MTAFKFWILYFEVTFYFDVFTKEILTYRIAARKGDRNQYIDGLEDVSALLKWQKEPVVLHTDQGSVYASLAYNNLIKDTVIIRSMSRAGKPTDNPVNESLNGWKKEELITQIKYLVSDGSYTYILSGSLLGTVFTDIRSIPVGYMDIMRMYPLDFEEFAIANGVGENVITALKKSFESKTPIDTFLHERMLSLFELYMIVGGMPAAVKSYLDTKNLTTVANEQQAIIELYKQDISKYDKDKKLYLSEIFDLIPSELNAKNKRFILKNLNENT